MDEFSVAPGGERVASRDNRLGVGALHANFHQLESRFLEVQDFAGTLTQALFVAVEPDGFVLDEVGEVFLQ